MKQELVELKSKLADAQDINKTNKKEITYLQKAASSSSIALELSETELSNTRKAYDRVRKCLDTEKTRSGHLFKRTKALLASTYRAKETKKKGKDSVKEVSDELEDQLTEVHGELSAAQKELADLTEEISRQDRQLEKKNRQLESKDAEMEEAHQLMEKERVEFERALKNLTEENSKLQYTVERLRIEEEELTSLIEDLHAKLDAKFEAARGEKKRLEKRVERLVASKNKLEDYRCFIQETLRVYDKGAYSPRFRNIIRFMIVRSCPLQRAGEILNCIYQILLKPLLSPSNRPEDMNIDQRTVKRIIVEGLVAARLQQYLETMRTICTSVITIE